MKSVEDRLYLGTWQFSGDFKEISQNEARRLIDLAMDQGINRFDTASVYGAGRVEELLGENISLNSVVVTKIPARRKPPLVDADDPRNYYCQRWLSDNVVNSLRRLRREKIETILLHNWSRGWGEDALGVIESLCSIRQRGYAERIGISLPNNFRSRVNRQVLELIDVIEAPYNPFEDWISHEIPSLHEMGKEVILRSVFLQGLLVKTDHQLAELSLQDPRRRKINPHLLSVRRRYADLLQDAWGLETSLTIGMTRSEQITRNLRYLRGLEGG